VVVRPERTTDLAEIAAVVEAAFDGRQVAQLVEDIRASPEYLSDLALVAEEAERVIGFAMISYAALEPGQTRVAMLSPVAVRPDRQRRGIGTALVQHALAAADARGEPLVVVEGIPAYYPRFGFRPATELGLEPPRPDISADAFMAAPLSMYDGSLRGRVVYPPAFDRVA
jgi:putative acetyltransferase